MPEPRQLGSIIAQIRAVIANPNIDTTLIQTQDLGVLCDAAERAHDLRAALKAVLDCDEKLDLHAYDYLHYYDEVRVMIKQVETALRNCEQRVGD